MIKNSHVAPHYDCLDLRNAVVPLMIPLMSHAADAGTNGLTMTKEDMLHLI